MSVGPAGVLGSSNGGSSNKAFCNVIAVFLLFTLHNRHVTTTQSALKSDINPFDPENW